MTSLFYASQYGHLEVARLLITHGADINAKNHDGQTAIDIAEENDKKNIVELLRSFLVKDVINRKGMEYKTRKALENAFEHHGHNFGMSRNVANPVSETILHSMGVGLSPTAATPFNTSAKERKRIAKQYENIGYGSQWKKMNTMKWVNNSRVGGSKNIRKTLRRKKTVRKTRRSVK
jgi:ankyrin repeat protein